MNKLQLMRLLANITPNHLSSYLSKTGWIRDGFINNMAVVWHRPEKENFDFEVVQPVNVEIRGVDQKIKEAIEAISEFEKRSLSEVVDDILNFFSDLIKVRVVHYDVDGGTIPLDDGVLLIEKSKELFVASTLSTFSKKKYFSGSRPENVQGFLSKLRLGQTDIGSFIINLISPIDESNVGQESTDKTSFTRSVITNLSKSLMAINVAVELYENDSNLFHFDEAVVKGVSANLCDALVGLSGELKSRSFEISIKLGGVEEDEQGVQLVHFFEPRKMPVLEFASEYYKGKYVLDNYTAFGLVIKMKHIKSDDYGEVTIGSLVNGISKNVTIQLDMNDYWSAVHAHESESFISCTGKLIVTPKSATLSEPRDFRVSKNIDMFDDKA